MSGAEYDAVVLDIMMPVLDGLSVLTKIRKEGNQVPVLLLTARDSIEDRVKGLDSGANDYLVKPFALEELLARIRVLLRRGTGEKENVCRVADLEVHWIPMKFCGAGRRLHFPERNFPSFAI